MSRFGPSRLHVHSACSRPELVRYWRQAGVYDAVCNTESVEQELIQELRDMVAQLVAMGYSFRAIDEYLQKGGFGPIDF